MLVRSLSAQNFRNFTDLKITPCEGVNVICGDNAQGKTNLLEAIWLFSGCRSFRGSRDLSLIKFGEKSACINMNFYAETRNQEATIVIEKKRLLRLNGVKYDSAVPIIGHFCAVCFSPDSLSLVREGPEQRRRFLDTALCQIKSGYSSNLSNYNHVLSQRNSLIRRQIESGNVKKEEFEVWNLRLAAASRAVADARFEYISALFDKASMIYGGISSEKEKLKLRYVSKMPEGFSGGTYEQLYELSLDEDIRRGFTTCGPHRDDIEITLNGKSARLYGSQGQTRSCALSLKLAEAELLSDFQGEQPVILLDDVMSELDEGRQSYVLNRLENRQVFVTCCDDAVIGRKKSGSVFRICGGNIVS